MFRSLTYAALENRLNRAYTNRLTSRGRTAKGVFWRSESSQVARFDALLSLAFQLAPKQPVSIADIGCGYGAMLDFIQSGHAFRQTNYHGVDINRSMINACRSKFPSRAGFFSVGNVPKSIVDFALFSGTFNLTYSDDASLWQDYIFKNLARCLSQCRYGLVLNLLCGPKMTIDKQIFYANRADFIARATRDLGPTNAISTRHVSGDASFVIRR